MDSAEALESRTTRSSARKPTVRAVRDRQVAPRFVGRPSALSACAMACRVAPPRRNSTVEISRATVPQGRVLRSAFQPIHCRA